MVPLGVKTCKLDSYLNPCNFTQAFISTLSKRRWLSARSGGKVDGRSS